MVHAESDGTFNTKEQSRVYPRPGVGHKSFVKNDGPCSRDHIKAAQDTASKLYPWPRGNPRQV